MLTCSLKERVRHTKQQPCFRQFLVHENRVVLVMDREEGSEVAHPGYLWNSRRKSQNDPHSQVREPIEIRQ